MKIKEQTRKLGAGCSKHRFEVVDETDEVSNHTYGKATLTRFEEIFEEYKIGILFERYGCERLASYKKTSKSWMISIQFLESLSCFIYDTNDRIGSKDQRLR